MSDSYPKELSKWAESLKIPIEELEGRYDEEVEKLTTNHPEWDSEQIASRALKSTFAFAKSLKRTRAKPYDIMVIGLSGVRDMNTRKRNTLLTMYANEADRDAALAGHEGARVKVLINPETGEETPIVVDDREMIEWDDATTGKHRTAKNRYYGKELPVLYVRDILAVGMKSFPDDDEAADLKVLRISAMRGSAEAVPPMWEPIRTRLNIRQDHGVFADARTVGVTSWNTKIDVPWVADDIKTMEGRYEFLGNMPGMFQVEDLDESLETFHELNADDFSRFCVVEADIAFLSTEPNSTGSYSMALEDMEAFDVDAEAIQGFLPAEIYPYVKDCAEGTHVRAIVRTTKSDVWDSEKGGPADPDPETGEVPQRIQFNYLMVAPDPEGIVEREEYEDADEIYEG